LPLSNNVVAAKQKAADSGGQSFTTTDNTDLTTAAVLFALCRLVVSAFALAGLRGRLFRGREHYHLNIFMICNLPASCSELMIESAHQALSSKLPRLDR
jgi:hypothetical protein